LTNENPHQNIVLVGTKLDLVDGDPGRREVTFNEAVELAHKMGLGGVIETSSKENIEDEPH